MITLLLGSDSVAKKNYVLAEAGTVGAELETITENSQGTNLAGLFEPQLFGPRKAIVLDHYWKNLSEDDIELLLNRGSGKGIALFIVEDSLDKRKKANQEFLKDHRVKVVEMEAPTGTAAASKWIVDYAKQNGVALSAAAARELAQALLVDEDSTLDVARTQNELAKLTAYSGGGEITAAMVEELTEKATGVDIFQLLNAIAAKNKKQAMQTLEQYFATEAADEKTNAIKVTALLADQFRSLLIAVDAGSRNLPDKQVLDMTGWKSGRLFMMKKLSRNFNAQQLKQALAKLQNLDQELKTGSLPPHVVLDLIIADM